MKKNYTAFILAALIIPATGLLAQGRGGGRAGGGGGRPGGAVSRQPGGQPGGRPVGGAVNPGRPGGPVPGGAGLAQPELQMRLGGGIILCRQQPVEPSEHPVYLNFRKTAKGTASAAFAAETGAFAVIVIGCSG